MLTHTAQVRGRKIAWDVREVVQHGLNSDVIKLDLDAEWRECDAISVVLCDSSLREPKRFVVNEDRALVLPPSMLSETGPFSTCVIGCKGGARRIVTAQERYPLVVVGSGCTGPLDPGEEQPDLWGQLMSAEAARIEAELARESAEKARADAEAKRFAAEKARETASAEAVRAANEAAAKAEQAARQAEDRVTAALAEVAEAEQARTEAEKARAAAESSRAEAEAARIAAESERESAEAKRKADSAKAVADASAATSAANAAAGKADAAAQTATDGEASRVAAETARAKAEQARAIAETGRVEAEATRAANESERTETFNTNLTSWNGKVDTACKKATDTASKAAQDAKTATSAAIAKTEEATNAAIAKVQTATDNATAAANKAEAAVAQLPVPSGNVLKGEAEATLVHVDDAYPAPLVTTKVLGQSNQQQEPAPSLENPQEITNLNKAELVITGRNICPDAELLCDVSYNVGIPTNRYGVQAKFPYVQTSETSGIGAVLNTIKGVTYSIAYLGKANTAYVGIAEYKSVDDVGDISKVVSYARVGSLKKNSLTASIDGVMVFILASQWSNGTTNLNTFAKEDMIISIGEPQDSYKPHKSKSTAIDLKGNELCSLPNGVKDEVVIDAEGNVSLIKRVAKVNLETLIAERIQRQSNGKWLTYIAAPQIKGDYTADCAICNKLIHVSNLASAAIHGNIFVGSNNLICLGIPENLYPNIDVEGAEATPQIKAWFNDIKVGTVVYGMATTPQTIQLGKVELPALPEATSNVWNDGNIPANVYVNYLKDVNIAFADLESKLTQAVVAAAANL